MIPVVAIDGPSGSGKGAVGFAVARRLGWHYLDSGAVYRALGFAALRAGVDLRAEPAVTALANSLNLQFVQDLSGEMRVLVNDEDCGLALRSEQVAAAASQVAAHPAARRALLERQRAARRPPGLIADGRDMGTVVFPDAVVKVYLTASAEVRAARRYHQLKETGFGGTLPQLLAEIQERDERDSRRAVAPLKAAGDAFVLDSSTLTLAEVIEQVLALVRSRVGAVPSV
ncbi:MAG: (d)CMP kinase [Gammaproteobacteria bacterium]|nr:(d)CMP kinase [Gammaproteobacteria bacterium]